MTAFPHIFATQPAGNVPAAYLDANFNACAQLDTQVSFTNINASQDVLRVQLGNFLSSYELSAGSFSNFAVVGGTAIPAGTFTGIATWPSGGVAGYALTANTDISAVGGYFAGGTSVAGGNGYGVNAVAINAELQAGASNAGHDFTVLYAVESDVVIKAKPGPSAPSGAGAGFIAILNAEIACTGDLSAYTVSNVGSVPWKTAYATNSGTATVGISLGAAGTSGPIDSQSVHLTALDGSSNPLLGSVTLDSVGSLVLNSSNTSAVVASSDPWFIFRKDNLGANNTLKVFNNTVNAGSTAGIVLQTGTANAFVSLYAIDNTQALLTVGAGLPNGLAIIAAGVSLSGNLTIGSGKVLQLGSTYSAGVVAATGTVTIKDATGTTYNVLVHT